MTGGAAEIGACRTCGQVLIRWRGRVWHPYTCDPCPASPYGRPAESNFISAGESI